MTSVGRGQQAALITGASAGIGLDLARLLAADGHDLVLVARNAERLSLIAAALRQLHPIEVTTLPIDLSQAGAAKQIAMFLDERNITIDNLINNAGIGAHGPFAESDLAEQLRLIQINLVALVELTRLLLPKMLASGRGKIINVASTAAYVPGPLMACYYASKAFVLSFSEAIAAEVAGSGVTITALCPGPTATEFHERAGIKTTPIFRANTMRSADVARIGYRGMLAGKRIVIPGWKNKFLTMATRLAPRRLLARIAWKLNRSR